MTQSAMTQSAALATAAPARAASRQRSIANIARALLPFAAGIAAALALVGLYVGLVSWGQDFQHARELLWDDRYFVGAIAAGFGTQAALYVYVRMTIARARLMAAGGVTAAGAGTSTAAMVACCAHHVADVLPLLGLSAAAVFLNDYRLPIMAVGLVMNAVGVVVLGRLALQQRRAARACLVGGQP
jgi:hypothetical protein